MKKNLLSVILLFSIIGLTSIEAFAQPQGTDKVLNGTNDYSKLAIDPPLIPFAGNWSKALGIYNASIVPFSQLEVNSNAGYLPVNITSIPRFEIFSTDAGDALSNWKMKQFGVEYGRIYSDNTDFHILSTNAKLWLHTDNLGTNTPRILVDDDATDGSVLVSNNAAGIAPAARLHVHETTATPSDIVITNDATNEFFGDGLRIGVNPFGTESGIMFQEIGGLNLGTNNLFRMRIIDNGRILVNANAVGIPLNRFVIDADLTDPTESGLQLVDLTSIDPTIPNPGPGVLSVDAMGNVIYVPGGAPGTVTGAQNGCSLSGTDVVLGGNTGSGAGSLINNREIPMDVNSIIWSTPAGSGASFGIGHAFGTATTTVGKFEVLNDAKNVAGEFTSTFTSGGSVYGVRGFGRNLGTGNAIGLSGTSFGTSGATASAIGVESRSTTTSARSIGVNSIAGNGTLGTISGNFDILFSTSPNNIGLQSDVTNATSSTGTNIGGDFVVDFNAAGSTNVGVRAYVPTATGGAGPDWAGEFLGDLFGSGTFQPSDRNLKKEINQIDNSLDIIKQLNPVNYYFDTDKHPNMGLATTKQWGFISQDVQKILPELTKQTTIAPVYDADGKELFSETEMLTLNYNGFIAILTDAIQEQQKEIDELKEMIGMMQQTNDAVNPNINTQDIELSDKDYVVLNQNVPNPFAEQTTISYVIPETASDAQIIFYNALGKMIKSVVISDRGEGRLNVYADDLSSGVYSYSLFVDSKLIDTRKMVKK